jgi:hypothetical protein
MRRLNGYRDGDAGRLDVYLAEAVRTVGAAEYRAGMLRREIGRPEWFVGSQAVVARDPEEPGRWLAFHGGQAVSCDAETVGRFFRAYRDRTGKPVRCRDDYKLARVKTFLSMRRSGLLGVV